MSDNFLGEIRIVPFNFAPTGWAFCDGQILPISQNTALFSLLGTQYGGDGQSTFALPNLQGQVPMDYGNGPGLTPRSIGESGGTTTVTLTALQSPAHAHGMNASSDAATSVSPSGALLAVPVQADPRFPSTLYATATASDAMLAGSAQATGGGQAHNNMQPYLTLNFVIALQGIFPSRD